MPTILAATDFSTRSDRALRRAVLFARQIGADLVLVHVVDEDRPARLVAAERREAELLLAELADTIDRSDAVGCRWLVRGGDPFAGVLEAAEAVDADVVLVGPPRRQLLAGVFTGTTAERVIRGSRRPVLVANGVPSAPYRRLLLATDLSEGSRAAASAASRLGLDRGVTLIAVHAFDAPASTLLLRTPVTAADRDRYVAERRREAGAALARFLVELGLPRIRRLVVRVDGTVAETLLAAARKLRADLVLVATRGRVGLGKLLLGSVAEGLLREAEIDVLAVPPDRRPSAVAGTLAGRSP